MSIYDYRDRPAYGLYKFSPPSWAQNKYILKWWSSDYDEIIKKQINLWHWVWNFYATKDILEITPKEEIEKWRKSDPLCSRYAWYNIISGFAKARAEQLGYTHLIRKPEWKKCAMCNEKFIEDSLPAPLIERLGITQIDFCSPCLCDSLFFLGNSRASRNSIIEYLKSLSEIIERVPPQNFGTSKSDLIDFGTEKRVAILKLLKTKPTVKRVKSQFGSWLSALIQAGILEDGTRKTSRGIQCLAKDGHVCLSLGEKTIDDFLYSHEIEHKKEPPYPEGNYRADFKVGDTLIEFFGLLGNKDYEDKIQVKIRICKKHNIKLISIYPEDLVKPSKLRLKLSAFLSLSA